MSIIFIAPLFLASAFKIASSLCCSNSMTANIVKSDI
jgi:hypothetical protein